MILYGSTVFRGQRPSIHIANTQYVDIGLPPGTIRPEFTLEKLAFQTNFRFASIVKSIITEAFYL